MENKTRQRFPRLFHKLIHFTITGLFITSQTEQGNVYIFRHYPKLHVLNHSPYESAGCGGSFFPHWKGG